jgi:hypothetical protein
VYINGYDFGDKLLEGVKFIVKKDGNGKPRCIGVHENDAKSKKLANRLVANLRFWRPKKKI